MKNITTSAAQLVTAAALTLGSAASATTISVDFMGNSSLPPMVTTDTAGVTSAQFWEPAFGLIGSVSPLTGTGTASGAIVQWNSQISWAVPGYLGSSILGPGDDKMMSRGIATFLTSASPPAASPNASFSRLPRMDLLRHLRTALTQMAGPEDFPKSPILIAEESPPSTSPNQVLLSAPLLDPPISMVASIPRATTSAILERPISTSAFPPPRRSPSKTMTSPSSTGFRLSASPNPQQPSSESSAVPSPSSDGSALKNSSQTPRTKDGHPPRVAVFLVFKIRSTYYTSEGLL